VLIERDKRLAVIARDGGPGRVYREGDALDGGARLVAIEPLRVVLGVTDGRRQLSLKRLAPQGEAGTGGAAAAARARDPGADASAWVRLIARRAAEREVDGQTVQGLGLEGLDAQRLQDIGLSDADLVTGLNGVALDEAGTGLALAQALDDAGTLSLTVLREQRELIIDVDAQAFAGLLAPGGDASP
jgi:type II secretory pathway component PulC